MEEHRQFLNRELIHRTKNILGLVRAIAMQTFDRGSDAERLSSFVSRIVALGSAHDLMLGDRLRATELREIVGAALQPHGLEEGRFDIDGPQLLLAPRRGLAMSLALNELATNAAKYGALRKKGGKVRIRWAREQAAAEGELLVSTWTESGGPAVTAPRRTGFGSKVITQQLTAEFRGIGSLHYETSGLRFELRAPWPEVGQNPV
jgi:two-component sensor histidine kinase